MEALPLPLAIISIMLVLIMLSSCAARHTQFMRQVEMARLKDGTYIGKNTVMPICGVKLSVTIKQERISEIEILRHFTTYPIAERAYRIIPQRIIQEQSIDVDAITTATVSTNSIKKAVLEALEKAQN